MKLYLLKLFSKFLIIIIAANVLFADGSVDFDKLFNGKKDNSNKEKIIESKMISSSEIEKAKQGTSQIEVQPTLVGAVGKSMFSGDSAEGVTLCYAIKSKDLMNNCISIVQRKESICYSIRGKDRMNSCIAITKGNESICYSIRNKDLMNSCIAITKRNESMCYNIRGKDLMNSCIAITKRNESMCYSIRNKDLMNSCIAIAK